MKHLLPCPSCGRHVRAFEPSCPFCSAELDLRGVPDHSMPSRRLNRAALFTFGATLALVTAACGSDDTSDTSQKGTGGSGGSADSAVESGSGGDMPLYGCPPPCGSGGESGASGASGSAGAAGGDASTAGAYGLPPDAG